MDWRIVMNSKGAQGKRVHTFERLLNIMLEAAGGKALTFSEVNRYRQTFIYNGSIECLENQTERSINPCFIQ